MPPPSLLSSVRLQANAASQYQNNYGNRQMAPNQTQSNFMASNQAQTNWNQTRQQQNNSYATQNTISGNRWNALKTTLSRENLRESAVPKTNSNIGPSVQLNGGYMAQRAQPTASSTVPQTVPPKIPSMIPSMVPPTVPPKVPLTAPPTFRSANLDNVHMPMGRKSVFERLGAKKTEPETESSVNVRERLIVKTISQPVEQQESAPPVQRTVQREMAPSLQTVTQRETPIPQTNNAMKPSVTKDTVDHVSLKQPSIQDQNVLPIVRRVSNFYLYFWFFKRKETSCFSLKNL